MRHANLKWEFRLLDLKFSMDILYIYTINNMYVLMHNRKQRFERVTRELKVTRVLSTLVEEMKAIGIATAGGGDAQSQCTDVMAPVAHSERSPVLLLMGGEMARGGAQAGGVLGPTRRATPWWWRRRTRSRRRTSSTAPSTPWVITTTSTCSRRQSW
jgi:hypothetical protein